MWLVKAGGKKWREMQRGCKLGRTCNESKLDNPGVLGALWLRCCVPIAVVVAWGPIVVLEEEMGEPEKEHGPMPESRDSSFSPVFASARVPERPLLALCVCLVLLLLLVVLRSKAEAIIGFKNESCCKAYLWTSCLVQNGGVIGGYVQSC